MFRQDPATLQHSEQAFEAALTVLSSSCPFLCRATMMSTSLLNPAFQVARPVVGFMVTSVMRNDEERLMQCLSTAWSTFPAN